MHLRTILTELDVSEHLASNDALLNRDFVCLPANADSPEPADTEHTVLLTQLSDLHHHVGARHHSAVIALTDRPLDHDQDVPPKTTICRSAIPFDVARQRFDRLAHLAPSLDSAKARLFDSFQRTYNIQQFTREAYDVIGNPLIVTDTGNRIIATAGDFPANRPDITEQLSKGYVSQSVHQSMLDNNVIEEARRNRSATISVNKTYNQEWITSIIYYKNLEMGRFDVLAMSRNFGAYDLELVEYAGALADILLDRMNPVAAQTISSAAILEDVMNNRFIHESEAVERLSGAGFTPSPAYALIMIQGNQSFATPNYNSHIGGILHTIFPESIWLVYNGYFFLLLPLKPTSSSGYEYYEILQERILHDGALEQALRNNSLRAYVSDPFHQILECREQLYVCRMLSRVIFDDEPISFCRRHRQHIMAYHYSIRHDISVLLDKRILRMYQYDVNKHTEYIATLAAHLRFPGNAAKAAASLNVHRNTYFYRLRKLQEIFHIDLGDGKDMIDVATTLDVTEHFPTISGTAPKINPLPMDTNEE
ncbi:PucR family transcriptional regulator [Bifidobacterium margollesii]|uniref:PucR family transcriptional regulator n=1 Tax=Bifidobacterium margollesii TaxID=2020964 RepID=A0A2N5JC19_9BIFI|nr:helix-turn-helix domain-containing protein [Bifidobacterium margollesii]PLS31762.1 PucR family transcriptional regulator [Bifidobacterium margollesii]